jgi:hydrogenase expression/formation protein HypE
MKGDAGGGFDGPRVTLAHGGGGTAMRRLVKEVFLAAFDNPHLALLEDQARLTFAELADRGARLAFTTDSYVIDPLFFPGGDIGSLAVYGTVNDLVVGGAVPRYLTCAVIIEEGTPVALLDRVAKSMAAAARRAGVAIVAGDTKVVPKGAADKLFVTTSGIGIIRAGRELGVARARPGDRILINGPLGDHGAAVLAARGDLALELSVGSDCAPLGEIAEALMSAAPGLRCMRDATRGGLAAVLNEISEASGVAIWIAEALIPVRPAVRGLCEILGLDALHLANEGKLVAVVPALEAEAALAAVRRHPLGEQAALIGSIVEGPPNRVEVETALGGRRILDLPFGDPLPRIC